MTYKEFLENKIDIAPLSGIEIDPSEINPVLKPHQRTSVLWALRGAAGVSLPGLALARPRCNSNGATSSKSTRAGKP